MACLLRGTCLCLPLPSCHVLERVWLVWVSLLHTKCTSACLSRKHSLRTVLNILLLWKQYYALTP